MISGFMGLKLPGDSLKSNLTGVSHLSVSF